jgi:hypothetical protein
LEVYGGKIGTNGLSDDFWGSLLKVNGRQNRRFAFVSAHNYCENADHVWWFKLHGMAELGNTC